MQQQERVQVNVRLPRELLDAVRRVASSEDRSVTSFVTRAVRAAIARRERKA